MIESSYSPTVLYEEVDGKAEASSAMAVYDLEGVPFFDFFPAPHYRSPRLRGMSGRSQHISGKSDRTTRITGGGLLGSQPTPPIDRSSSTTNVIPLFRSAPDEDQDDESDEGDFEPVASTSTAVPDKGVTFLGQKQTTRLSTLPPPPKKKPKTATGKREYVEGEKEVATPGQTKGKGKGKAGKTGKDNMEKHLTTANVQFPPHFLKLEKTFKVSH